MSQSPLIQPADLANAMACGERIAIVDTRSPEEYAKGHIPGAVNVRAIFTYLAMSTLEGLSAMEADFTKQLGEAGVSGDERVVLYEDAMSNGYGQSCRGWFLLKYLGHPRVEVLHGGLQAWRAEGRPTTTETPEVAARTFTADVDRAMLVTWEEMRDALDDPNIIMLDVRDLEEWTGESSSPYGKDFAPRKGRIPGAVWIEWYRMMRKDAGVPWFRPAEEVRRICAEVGIEPGSRVYLYCFKGARASNTLIAMKDAGIDDVRLYFGSWNEWARNPELPIETGAPDPARMARRD